jgi:hypothetical protein
MFGYTALSFAITSSNKMKEKRKRGIDIKKIARFWPGGDGEAG